jgi:hypothetical protein
MALFIESEDQKMNILLGHRINTIRTYLRDRGIHYSSKDDKKTLAKLLLDNDPNLDDIPDTVSVSSVEVGSSASMRTPIKTTRPSTSRYDLRSGSKRTRNSSASSSSSSSSHHFSPGGLDPEEFIFPEVKSFHPKRKIHHKKSPKQIVPIISPKKAPFIQSVGRRSRKSSNASDNVVGTRRSKRLSSGTETSETSGDFIVEDVEETTDQEQTDENLTADERIPTEESNFEGFHTEGLTQPLESIRENPVENADAQLQPKEHQEVIPLPQPDPVIEHQIEAIADTHDGQEQHHELMKDEQLNSSDESRVENPDLSTGEHELPSSSDEMEFEEGSHDNTSIPSQDPGTGNNYFQFQPAFQHQQQQQSLSSHSDFRGSGGRGKVETQVEASSVGEAEDEEEGDSSDSEDEYYETNTINSEDESQQLKTSYNASGQEVFDLMDDSASEMTDDNRENELIREEVKQQQPAETNVSHPQQQQQSSESSTSKVEEDVVSKNPVIQEAMEAFSKLGSKFIIAITDDQQQSSSSSLPALSDKEYDLLKTFLERMRPSTKIEEPLPHSTKANQSDEITVQKEATPQKEISIQTEPVSTSTSSGPDGDMDVATESTNSNQRKGVQWNIDESNVTSSKKLSSVTDSSPFLTTPQLYRFEGRNTHKATPYNFRPSLSTPGSEDTTNIGSSSKKRVLSDFLDGNNEDDEEDREHGFDHARKRISFGTMEPPSSKQSSVPFSSTISSSSSLVPVPSSTAFQSNLKFNLINNNFLSSNAYIPKFRGNAISFAKNNEIISQKPDFLNTGRNGNIAGSGLSFLEKRKLEKKEQERGSTASSSSSSSGVVAKEILKALSDITSPIEEFRKQPIPRIYPNDLFGTFPKPNLFTNLPASSSSSSSQQQQQQSAQTKATEAPLTSCKQEKSVSFNLSSSSASSKKNELEKEEGEEQPEMLMSVTKQTPSSQQFSSPFPSFTFSQPTSLQTPVAMEQKQSKSQSSQLQQQSQQQSEFTFGEPIVIADESSVSSSSRVSDASIKYIFSPPAKGGRKRKVDSVGGSKSVEKSSISTPSTSLLSSSIKETEKQSSTKPSSAVPSIWSNALLNKGIKCSVCRVPNDESAYKCISCDSVLKEDKKPTYSSNVVATTAPSTDIWSKFTSTDGIKCTVCMVRNNKGATKCVSCESPLETAATDNKTKEIKNSAPVLSSSTGGFQFGATPTSSGTIVPSSNFTFKAPESSVLPASSSTSFQFGSAPPALSVKMPAVDTGFMFKPSTNKDSNNNDDTKTTSSVATASFSFDKTSYSSNAGNQPAISPSLPFTPLHANSGTTPGGFAFKPKNIFPTEEETSSKKQERDEEDDDDDDEDRSKRNKRKNSDGGENKIKFSFGSASAPSQQSLTFPPLPGSGSGIGGFTFGAGKTTTSVLPSIPEKKRGRDDDEEEGSPPKKEEKQSAKQEESNKPVFTFGGAPASSTIPTSGFTFGTTSQQQPEKSVNFQSNAKDNNQKDFSSSSFTSAPVEQKPTTGVSFSFSAGSTSVPSDAKKTPMISNPPLPAGPPPSFTFGATPSNNDSKPTTTVPASLPAFKFGSDSTASTSFPKVNKEEVKPASSFAGLHSFGSGVGSSTVLPSTAFTGGKVTPPPAPSSGNNNMSNTPSMSMDSPNPTDHLTSTNVSSTSQPSLSLSSAPFTFGASANSNTNSIINQSSSNPFSSSFTAPSTAAPFSSNASTSSAFPSANPFPAFGTAPSSNTTGNPFGVPASTLPSTSSNTNLFNAGSLIKLPPTTTSIPAFSSNNNLPASAGMFGQPPSSAASGSSIFGGLSGGSQPAFGGNQPQASNLGGNAGLFGSTAPGPFGSGGPPANPAPAPFTFGAGSSSTPAFGAATVPGGSFPSSFPVTTPSFGGFNNSIPSNSSGLFNAGGGSFGGDTSQNNSSNNLVGLGGGQGGMAAGGSAFNLGKADTSQQARRKLRVKRP